MGTLTPKPSEGLLVVAATIICYGNAATYELALQIADDIARYWNEPKVTVQGLLVNFDISGIYNPGLQPEEVWYNTNPVNNFYRIEEYSAMDISFVDGLGSNTGYFKLANLLHTGSTAAHEFGHGLGLDHPAILDIRGQGQPGIMSPRGTLVDAIYQYNPEAPAGVGHLGGTMDAAQRKVLAADVEALRLERALRWFSPLTVIGDFSNQWHEAHVP
ncbi:MAG TPA: peptidase M10 [Phnomibacter sp.]|nr:peptidase M10 [Phnomibacter sp.]